MYDCLSVGTSVELEGVVLPSGLIVNMITPYDLLTDSQLGTTHVVVIYKVV